MRATDKEHILATVRQATMDYEKEFTFPYKWIDSDGRNHVEKFKVTLNEVDDPTTQEHIEDLVSKYGEQHREFFADLNKDGTFRTTPAYHRAAEYADLEQSYEVTAPKSGLTIQLSYLAGWGERFLSSKKNPSTNTLIEARKPKYKDEGGNWVLVRVRDLHMRDIEYLRECIKAYEGSVDMVLSFEDPKDPNKLVDLNLLSQTAFFFPSGAL